MQKALSQNVKSAYLVLAASIIGILALTAGIYWPGLAGPFLIDDFTNITSNYVAGFNIDEILYAVTHNTSGVFGRPLSVLSFLLSGIIHGPEPWGYKFHNLMLHLVNGMLILWLLIRLLPRLAPGLAKEKVYVIAGITASCWLLHPLMVSTVLYAVQRMAQLSSFFTLAAVLIYTYARETAASDRIKYAGLSWGLFPLVLIMAMLSKENGALIPFYLLAVEYICFGFKFDSLQVKKRILIFQAVFVALPIVLGSYYLISHFDELVNYSSRDFTLVQRLMTQLHVVAFYIKLILLPALSDMSLFHDGWPVVERMDALTAVLLLVFIFSTALMFYLRSRAPVVAFGVAWFIVSHLMESTFIHLELVFEHRNYLAALGFLLIPIYYLVTLMNARAMSAVAVILVALLTFMTFARVQEWKDEETIYSIAVQEHPESLRAQTAYASLLYNYGNLEESLRHIDIVAELDETEFGSLLHKLVYLCGTDRDKSGLFAEAYHRAENYPVSASSFYAIERLIEKIRREECPEIDLDQLLDIFQLAMNQEDNREKKNYLGFLQRHAAQIYYLKGEFQRGYEHMIHAYENTGMASILAELASYEMQLGSLETSEHLIALLEEIDATSLRSETIKINELKEELSQARERARTAGSGNPDEGD